MLNRGPGNIEWRGMPLRCHVEVEWDPLRLVAVVPPKFFSIEDPVNDAQRRHYASIGPRLQTVQDEHASTVRALQEAGAEVLILPPTQGQPLQFNVRDAGIVVDGQLILGCMTHRLRKSEPDLLQAALSFDDVVPLHHRLEGGDVALIPGIVLVGLSQRTDRSGLKDLQRHIEGRRRVVAIRLHPTTLHLDVALTVVAPNLGLMHRPSILDALPDELSDFEWIQVTSEEYEQQAVNVLVVDQQTVLMDSRQKRLRDELESRGVNCIPVPLSDISKIGGGIRCMTLPLVRLSKS